MLTVLSLFDGVSCGQEALRQLGVPCRYYASETDPHAIAVAQANFPSTVQLGDVRNVRYHAATGTLHCSTGAHKVGRIDLLLGGSPCQGLSRCGQRRGLEDARSSLYYHYERLLQEARPAHFLLENVRMGKAQERHITERLGVGCRKLDSSEVSAQHRLRLYWSTLPLMPPPPPSPEAPLTLPQLLGDEYEGLHCRSRGKYRGGYRVGALKAPCVTTSSWQHNFKVGLRDGSVRQFTAEEVEQLQTLPVGYTSVLASTNRRIKLVGNGWTVAQICRLLAGVSMQK
jgi:DNA (cytosine-5)-methyltransferase 3A